MPIKKNLYINGLWVDAKGNNRFAVINPLTKQQTQLLQKTLMQVPFNS